MAEVGTGFPDTLSCANSQDALGLEQDKCAFGAHVRLTRGHALEVALLFFVRHSRRHNTSKE
jgi:hypothetical protein